MTRRKFMGTAAATAGAARAASGETPALLGGKPVRKGGFAPWPQIQDNDEKAWTGVLRGGRWNRLGGKYAGEFEEAWARTLGAKRCLATANGTSALIASLYALGVGPGDEVDRKSVV